MRASVGRFGLAARARPHSARADPGCRGVRDAEDQARRPGSEAAPARSRSLAGAEIFLNPRTGEPWTGDQATRKTMWTPILKRAGVRYRRPYQTRHTCASMMLTAGESPVWLAQQMGHSDFTMIARTERGSNMLMPLGVPSLSRGRGLAPRAASIHRSKDTDRPSSL